MPINLEPDISPANDSGRISKTILTGDENLADANTKLKSSIDSYNTTLANIHLRIDLKTYELVKGNSL